MKLRRKIMIAIIILIFIPVTAMGLISYFIFSDAMERKTNEFHWISLQETDRRLQYALSEINSVSDLSITQPLVQRILKRTDIYLTNNEEQDLNTLLLTHPKITSINIFSNKHLIYNSGSSLTLTMDQLRSQPWFSSLQSLGGRPLWLGPYENAALVEDPMLLTHARTIKDYYSLEDIGVLIVTVKSDILEQVFWESSTLNNGEILLVNQQGTIIFSKSGDAIGESVSFPFLQNDQYTTSYIDTYNDNETFISYLPSHNKGWYLVALTSLNELRAESNRIRNVALGFLIFSLFTALLFDLLFVSKLVKSISMVVSGMKRVETGRFIQIKSPFRHNLTESGMLLTGFNRLSNQISELIQKVEFEQKRKKQAEIQALVAQINPHFIYNSLESINSLAVIHGNREISKMVISLGKLLRISISQNQELIPISMELEHVKHYLLIQKFRFEDKFEYTIHLAEEVIPYYTLKLIVQPIVENALYHGIEPMTGVGLISIRAWSSRGNVFIEVADNGLGFDTEKLTQGSGVGLMNVHERIRISFGSPYGIMICSTPGEGTIIRIQIPQMDAKGTQTKLAEKGEQDETENE